MKHLLTTFYLITLSIIVLSCSEPEKEIQTLSQSAEIDNISQQKAEALLSDSTVVFIDVRSQMERKVTKIPDSRHISIHGENYAEHIAALDTGKTYVVYCHSGPRSKRMARQMKQHGLPDVLNLKGGISSWNGPTN